jgi:hypothetical protein
VLKSRTLSIQIHRAVEEVYTYVSNPANLSGWTMVEGGRRVPGAGPLVWTFSGPRGDVAVHFTPLNPHFILDYKVHMEGRVAQAAYVRLVANGDGTELVHTSIQQKGVPDEAFESEAEWMRNDLLVLKTLLEAR